MKYERLIKQDKKTLIRLIESKDEQLLIVKKRIENQDKTGKIFFNNKYYWMILEEIKGD